MTPARREGHILQVRRESRGDSPAIHRVICVAFSTLSDPEPKEATLVAELRAHSSFIPELSLVAELNGELVGHVMCTRATVKTSFCPWSVLALAPLSVVPEHQRQGIGKALMYAIIGAADALHEPFIGVLGDPKYYSRFDFVGSNEYNIAPPEPAWQSHFQILALHDVDSSIRGTFAYATPFQRLE